MIRDDGPRSLDAFAVKEIGPVAGRLGDMSSCGVDACCGSPMAASIAVYARADRATAYSMNAAPFG
jgi:hypothetical protein